MIIKGTHIILLILIILTSACKSKHIDGTYSGLIEMCTTDSKGKKDCYVDSARLQSKWYHLVYLKIRGDSIYSDQNPVAIDKNDTIYSASDGAFYYYKGTIKQNGEALTVNLKEIACDYCGEEVRFLPNGKEEFIREIKTWKGQITENGLVLNNILFKPFKMKNDLISEKRIN